MHVYAAAAAVDAITTTAATTVLVVVVAIARAVCCLVLFISIVVRHGLLVQFSQFLLMVSISTWSQTCWRMP